MIINFNKIKCIYGKITRIKTPFLEMENSNGKIQIYFKKKLKIGDIIFTISKIKKTKLGVFYLFPLIIKIIVRNIKFIKKKILFIKKKIFSTIFFLNNYLQFFMFLNINSSSLCKTKSSSNSNNFKTYVQCKKKNYFLKISPEFSIKKMLSLNINRIYEITKCYRNEGVSCIHNYEFFMLEYYSANFSFENSIFFLEKMLKNIFLINKKNNLSFFKLTFLIHMFFKKKSIMELLLIYFNEKKFLFEKKFIFLYLMYKNSFKIRNLKLSDFLFKIFDKNISKKLIFPVFVKKFTKISSPLSKPYFLNLNFSKRFELYFSGIELANGFDELNDYFVQKKNIKKTNKDFLSHMKNSLYNTCGVGIGIDRLNLILNNINNIKKIL